MSKTQDKNCYHKGHYRFLAKRLIYKGLGNTDYVYFTVYSHYRKLSRVRDSPICAKVFGVYEQIGTLKENDLVLVHDS